MSRRYPTIKAQELALDEMKRVLNQDMKVLTSDYSIEEATPEILRRVVLFDGILHMFDIFEEKVTAGVMLAGKIKGQRANVPKELIDQAEICLELLIGPEEDSS